MRNRLVASSAVVVALTMLPGVVAGQQGGKIGDVLVSQAGIVDFTKEEVGEIVITREDLQRTGDRLRQADNALRDYIRASMQVIMQAHQDGFAEFDSWYRRRDARLREEAAQHEVVAKICGQALGMGLDIVIPGSGVFVSSLRSWLTFAYNEASQQIASFKGGDPDLFLSEQRRAIERIRSSYLTKAEEIPNQQAEALESMKYEYLVDIEERGGTSSGLSTHMQQIAAHYGIPAPDDKTIERTKLAVLEAHIRGVFEADPQQHFAVEKNFAFPSKDYYFTAISREHAYRHAFAGQPDRYCPVELEFWAGLPISWECSLWRIASR